MAFVVEVASTNRKPCPWPCSQPCSWPSIPSHVPGFKGVRGGGSCSKFLSWEGLTPYIRRSLPRGLGSLRCWRIAGPWGLVLLHFLVICNPNTFLFQILILPRLGPRPCQAVPPSGRAPALAKFKFAKFLERTNERTTNERAKKKH